jgi:uncharacterized protein YigE (DUF2233 family)
MRSRQHHGLSILLLRIDPATWSLECLTPDDTDKATLLTARQWCEQHDLTAAINAGMFAVDFRTHVGFAAARGKVRCASGRVSWSM